MSCEPTMQKSSRRTATHAVLVPVCSMTHLSPWSLISFARLASPRMTALPGAPPPAIVAQAGPGHGLDDHPEREQPGHDQGYRHGHGLGGVRGREFRLAQLLLCPPVQR